jgi:hypothetical protein
VFLVGPVERVVLEGFFLGVICFGGVFVEFVLDRPPPWPSNGPITDISINAPDNSVAMVL